MSTANRMESSKFQTQTGAKQTHSSCSLSSTGRITHRATAERPEVARRVGQVRKLQTRLPIRGCRCLKAEVPMLIDIPNLVSRPKIDRTRNSFCCCCAPTALCCCCCLSLALSVDCYVTFARPEVQVKINDDYVDCCCR